MHLEITSLNLFLVTLFIFDNCNARVNLTCTKHSDCPLNASCENGKVCFCNLGYIDDIKDTLRCIKEAEKYGDYCEQDIQCTGLLGLKSICQHDNPNNAIGKCVCTKDSHYRDGICFKNSFIGDRCLVTDDCTIRNQDLIAYCEHGTCICPPKHIPSLDKRDCLLAAGLDEKCGKNKTCSVPNSKCQEYCTCEMGYVPSSDNQRCLKAADNLDDNCEEESQCTEFLKLSTCDLKNKRCGCQKFTHRLIDQCWMKIELNSLCEYDSECFVVGSRAGVECKEGTCSCKSNYTSIQQSCVLIAEAGFGPRSTSGSVLSQNHIFNYFLVLQIIIIFVQHR